MPTKERLVRQNSNKWFDGKMTNENKNRDKLFKKLKNQNYTLTKIFAMRQDIK